MAKLTYRIMAAVFLFTILYLCSCSSVASTQPAEDNTGVKITELEDRLRIEINGQLFTEYRFKDVAHPHFYPIVGPTGEIVVRRWPVEEGMDGPYEQHDHRGHIGLWFGHPVNDQKLFWCAGKVHDKFLEIKSAPGVGVIKAQTKWVDREGDVVCTDVRTFKIYNRKDERIMDCEITIQASESDITLDDSKEGSMAIRLATSMALRLDSLTVASRFRLKRREGEEGGHIVNSEGLRDDQTWGKRAAWCDYYGPVKGQIVGVAIFDHPENPRHPTWWMVRDYGLHAANPFGAHSLERKPFGTGDLFIPKGQSVTFKYRFYFHKGDEKQGQVAQRYRKYAIAACSKAGEKCSKASTECTKAITENSK